jgi:hypothetical protein
MNFVDLPNELRTAEVAEHFGESVSTRGSGIVVCGSPNEVANDPTLGYQFDVTTGADTVWGLERQRGKFAKKRLCSSVSYSSNLFALFFQNMYGLWWVFRQMTSFVNELHGLFHSFLL